MVAFSGLGVVRSKLRARGCVVATASTLVSQTVSDV